MVYAFATPEMDGENDVVIAHELLHTVGASDKYLPGNDAPRFPDGYGDPNQCRCIRSASQRSWPGG